MKGPFSTPIRSEPLYVLTRAQTLLRITRQGLHDMEETDHDRVIFGFFGVAVFGRSITFALQKLRSFDERAFNEWYTPWQQDMREDPLMRLFVEVRDNIVHETNDLYPVVLWARGSDVPRVGEVRLPADKLPTMHRGQPISDPSTYALCKLYILYLEDLVESAGPVVVGVQERWEALH